MPQTQQVDVKLENWPVLPSGAGEAIRLLRENPRGFYEHHGRLTDGAGGRCALGLLYNELLYFYGDDKLIDEYTIQQHYGFTPQGMIATWETFDGEKLTFREMADIMEQRPRDFFRF